MGRGRLVRRLGSAWFGVRRDLSFLYRLAFWLLVGLIAASINVFLLFLRLFARSS